MAFTIHLHPNHVHIVTSCIDHTSCSNDHWRGGRPQSDHPHHVEINCLTGLVGYTRLTAEEIKEQKLTGAEEIARQEVARAQKEADLALFREEAHINPGFAALLRHLGLK